MPRCATLPGPVARREAHTSGGVRWLSLASTSSGGTESPVSSDPLVLGVDVGGTKVAVGAIVGRRRDPHRGVAHAAREHRRAPRRDRGDRPPGDRPGGPARGGGRGGAVADRLRHRHRRVEREHPAHRRPAACGARAPLRRAGVRGQRRQLRRAGRGPAGGRRPGERARDAHARHRRRRGRGDRGKDLPRGPRPGCRARSLHDRPGGAALPRQLSRPRLRGGLLQRPGARARRHRVRT